MVRGKPYSLDLWEGVCSYVAKGHSAQSAGRFYGESTATAVRFAAAHRNHGAALATPKGAAGRFGKRARWREFLLEITRADPGIPFKEHAAAPAESYGLAVQLTWLHCAIERLERHINGLIAAERDRPSPRPARRD